jgi:hypothetical protein
VALALTDEQMAQILIAGTGLSVKKQCRLLRLLANAVDPPPPSPPSSRSNVQAGRLKKATKRAGNRARWRAWHRRHQAGEAIASPVVFNGVVLAKLIMSGWLARSDAETYSTKAVAEAITTLLAEADLPPRK